MDELTYLDRLGPAELRQHVEQSHALWGWKQTLEERLSSLHKRLEEAGPERFHLSGLIDAEGILAASLKRYYFPVRVRGETLQAVGLGAIFTRPASRAGGFASRLIRTVLEESGRERGCSVSVLYSDIDPAFYRRLGFEPAPAERWRIQVPQLPMEKPFTTRVAAPSDRACLLDFYYEQTRAFAVSTARTEESWPFFRSINRVDKDLLLLENDVEIGFLSISYEREEGPFFVEEWAAPEGSEARVWATVARLAEDAGYAEVRGWSLPTYRGLSGTEQTGRTRAIPMVASLRPGAISPADLSASYFAPPDHF